MQRQSTPTATPPHAYRMHQQQRSKMLHTWMNYARSNTQACCVASVGKGKLLMAAAITARYAERDTTSLVLQGLQLVYSHLPCVFALHAACCGQCLCYPEPHHLFEGCLVCLLVIRVEGDQVQTFMHCPLLRRVLHKVTLHVLMQPSTSYADVAHCIRSSRPPSTAAGCMHWAEIGAD